MRSCVAPMKGYDPSLNMKKEQTAKMPWWGWLSLLGLKAPIAAVIWAVAFSRVFHLVQEIYWTYQFLLVAVWCVTMGSRLITVFYNDPEIVHDARLYFVKSNCVWLTFCVLVAVICGLWTIFFQVGVGMISYASLPLLMSIFYLMLRTTFRDKKGSLTWLTLSCLCGAAAFSFGVAVPAYFYGIPNAGLGFFFYTPIWYLTIYIFLILMYRHKWMMRGRESERDEQTGLGLWVGILLLLVFCLISAWHINRFAETWFFYALGFGCACLYILERFLSKKLSSAALCAFGWVVLCLPALFLWALLAKW